MSDISQFEIIRSHRRTISLEISREGKLIVKAPQLIPKFILTKFVHDKSEWIERHLAQIKTYPVPKTKNLGEGSELPYLGQDYPLHIGDFKQVSVTKNLNFPKFLVFRMKKEITDWYISQAKKHITERLEYYTGVMKTKYVSVSYSDTNSKWGSCSHDNRLQFSWRLIMAPLLIIDYVVVHELAHTRVKNHSSKFWKEVAVYKPAYKQYVKWLKANSHKLHTVI